MATKHLTNRRTVKTTDFDHYRTPFFATQALMYYERFQGSIAEPCCGTGEMAEVLKKRYEVIASDLVDRGYGKQSDYLKFTGRNLNTITNPPFDVAEKIIEQALNTTEYKVCMLLRLAFLEGQTRFKNIYSQRPPARIRVFSERVSMYKGDCDRTDGGTTAYAWYIWDLKAESKHTEICWIKPGFKNGMKRFRYGKREHSVL